MAQPSLRGCDGEGSVDVYGPSTTVATSVVVVLEVGQVDGIGRVNGAVGSLPGGPTHLDVNVTSDRRRP